MTLKQMTSTDLKNMDYDEYKKIIKDYATKNGYNMPSNQLIEFFHERGIYINIAFDMFKSDIGKRTS